jgi:hypothetical protein
MPYVTVGKENIGNVDLYYEDRGSGEPIIPIHRYPLNGPREIRFEARQQAVFISSVPPFLLKTRTVRRGWTAVSSKGLRSHCSSSLLFSVRFLLHHLCFLWRTHCFCRVVRVCITAGQ